MSRENITLRDRFVLDYGDLAVSNPRLAHTAFVYWKSIEPYGRWRIEEVPRLFSGLIKGHRARPNRIPGPNRGIN